MTCSESSDNRPIANVLIIDDDPGIRESISHVVQWLGHRAISSSTLQEALRRIASEEFDMVFLDVRLPDGDGLEFLPRIQAASSSPEVIIMTGYGDPDGAELAMKHGAWEYIEKPSSVDAILSSLYRALQYRAERRAGKVETRLKRDGIVGDSLALRVCLERIDQVAASDANVLITGETGTGKELFASAIHRNSGRAGKPFVVVDCAALPENLVESTLFGHTRGAYTGADRSQDGLILQANEGTLFLDEVGELPLMVQKSFLRVFQEKRFRPVGGLQEIASDFRVVSASNRNLEEMMREGKFREDLLFRLRAFSVRIPPLRERVEDIQALAAFYMNQLCKKNDIELKEFSPEIMEVFKNYAWPGNVRELINALESALVNGKNEKTLVPKHLPTAMRALFARSAVTEKTVLNRPEKEKVAVLERAFETIQEFRDKAIADAEETYLNRLLLETGGDMREMTRFSGLSRSRLYSLFKKYGLKLEH